MNANNPFINGTKASGPAPDVRSKAPGGSRQPLRAACRMLLLICLLAASAKAADRPFDMSANWGGTGLMEIPTARILPDGAMRLGVAEASPYIWYTFGFGLLPGLEFSGRYTDVTNVEGKLGSDFGSFKDKAFDVKYQLLPESKRGPAIALGWNDFEGTKLFESQYLVISRQLYPLDLTLGVGRRRLKGPVSIGDEVGFWGGVEWALTDRLHLMLEYNPIEYQKDPLPVRGVPDGSDLPFNAGLRYRTWLGFDLGLTCQRGQALGFTVHLQFELGRPILPPRPDAPSWQFAAGRDASAGPAEQRVRRLAAAIEEAGFSDVRTTVSDGALGARIENDRYLSDTLAAGRVMRLMLAESADDGDTLTVTMNKRGLEVLHVSAAARDVRRYFMGDMPADDFAQGLSVTPRSPPARAQASSSRAISAEAQNRGARKTLDSGIDPVLESYFNDPSGIYHSRLSLKPFGTLNLWPGASLHGSCELPLYTDVESVNTPLPDAVRSDSWQYLGGQPAVNRLLFDQMMKLTPHVYARVSAGYLERMFAGLGGEVLTFTDQGRWALGLESDCVRKRDPDDAWGLTDQSNHTLLGNLYYRYLPLDIILKGQAGRFLAGDTGVRMEFRRRFDTGAEIGIWYSITDTDQLSDFNRGNHDKGIFLKVPFATFTDYPTRTLLQYRISPWTRDTGATINHWQEIYDTAADLTPIYFRHDLRRFSQ